MLQEMFMNIVTMSLTAIPVILVVLLARMVLKSAPKVFSYALWAVVLFRLLCSFSFEMNFSLIPDKLASGEIVENYAESYVGDVKVYEAGTTEYKEALELGMEPATSSEMQIVTTVDGTKQAKTVRETLGPVLSGIWILGIVALISYSFGSLVQLKRRLVSSVPHKDNIYLADYIDSPFVLGLIKPRIYLPSTMPKSEYEYTILHEEHHIKRMDHVVKGVAFAALCIHWFNPFVWLAFVLAMTDMEMSCDEAVLRKMGENVRTEYSSSLLRFAIGKQYVPATFLAFGEVNPKARIKNILKWKRPVVVFSIIAAVFTVLVGIICLSNPLEEKYLEKTSSIVSNNNRNNWVAEDEDYIYFIYMTEVKKISKKDNSVETIYAFTDERNLVNTFEYFDGRLYFVTDQGDFISINTDGSAQITSKFAAEGTDELLEVSLPMPTPYVLGENLYFLAENPRVVYRVNPETLSLEATDSEIRSQYQIADGTIFTLKVEGEKSRLYVTTTQGEEKLFSAEDESILDCHYTNAYVFYQAFKVVDSEIQTDSIYLYRADLDGENKVLVKEIVVAEFSGNVSYDNEYAYIYMNESGYLRIHKATLDESKLESVPNEVNGGNEISDGKFFSIAWPYFIDSETGETTNFTMTE